MTTTIASGQGLVTQINVFTVDPSQVDQLVDTLKEAAKSVKDVPGWVSINLHVALDGTRVTNYAQCETQGAWDEVMEILYAKGFIDRLIAIGTPDPCLYDVRWTLDRGEAARS